MKRVNPQLGQLEMRFFTWVQFKNKTQVRQGDIGDALGITPKQERELLSRLSRRGLILRIQRGFYIVPPKLPPGGQWQTNELIVADILMQEKKALYQIGGPWAFHFYRWDDQTPNAVYVYNDKISGERKIGGLVYYFLKIPRKRLGGTQMITIANTIKIPVASPARTLMDAVYDWDRYNTLPRAYDWIRNKSGDKKFITQLADMAIRYGNIGTRRRIGYCLETCGSSTKTVQKLKKNISSSSSFIPWIPGRPMKGTINRKWGLIINAENHDE
ncbi:MAG: type IV toxin-antitoxin system AbiEi family antitoxin domain-containing protein [Deltaproteobacteria bacterium]|nr:type IV toxin-antitoxin system AbiEi family antitoxin domain-containing protein [Deltaproteobacteria bacterium]